MKLVIDSNYLDDPSLETFFSSPCNIAVLTDWMWIEIYKCDDPETIYRRTRILARHTGQIIILRSLATIARLRGRRSRLTQRMIWDGAVEEFEELCRTLETERHSPLVLSQIRNHQKAARNYIDIVEDGYLDFVEGFKEVAKIFNPHAQKILRTGTKPDTATISAMITAVDGLSRSMLRRQKYPHKIPHGEIENLLIFRFAVCGVCLAMRWIRRGSPPTNRDRIRNDCIDLSFAAFGTYFDGILSKDQALNDVHNEAWAILKHMGAAVPSR